MLHLFLFYVTDIGSVMAIWKITEYIIGTVPQLRTNCVQFLYKSIYLTFSLALFMFFCKTRASLFGFKLYVVIPYFV